MDIERDPRGVTAGADLDPEIVWVADASDPDPEMPIVDLQRVDPPLAPEPDAAELRAALCERAATAAAAHLDQLRRRTARRRSVPNPPFEVLQDELAPARFCVIDTETTGARPGLGDELLEIGALRVVDSEFGLEFSSLVRPLGPITAGAYGVHGITTEAAAGAPPIEAVLPYVVEMARDCILVFHNAPFDLGFLQRALSDAGRPVFEVPVIDTLVVARRLLGGRCGLGILAERLGLEGPHSHRALPDARLTARLWIRLLAFLRAAGAERLEHVPGIAVRPPRLRRRRTPRGGLLLQRLEQAWSGGEVVRLACHAGRGMAPLALRVRFLEVAPHACIVFDIDTGTTRVLDPARILALESAS